MRNRLIAWLVWSVVASTGVSMAQDAPVVAAAESSRKDQLRAFIAASAKAEGAIADWDAVITPETNDELSSQFRKLERLPASFAVKYTQSATLNLVTRVDQEVGSGNVTIDVASLASPPWINSLVRGEHIMKYDSPSMFDGPAWGSDRDGHGAGRETPCRTEPIVLYPPGTARRSISRARRGAMCSERCRPPGPGPSC